MSINENLLPHIEFETIDRTIPNGKADEIIRFFYDAVKKHDGHQYFRDYLIKGEVVKHVHSIWKIEPPKDNRLKALEVIYSANEYKPGDPPRLPKHITGLDVKAWQIQTDLARVKIQYVPFYADIVQAIFPNASREVTPAADATPTEKQKHKAHYRLTKDDIRYRKNIVKKAEALRKENPKLLWQKIADEVGVPERTLRDWRHNPIYK